MVYALFIEYPATGFVQLETFPTAFDRAIKMIALRGLPLVLSTREYAQRAA